MLPRETFKISQPQRVHFLHSGARLRSFLTEPYILFISLGRVHESEVKGASIQMKTKQSMEMQVVSLVFLEISRQLGSVSCLLMTAVEIPGFTTADMVVWFRGQYQKDGKMLSENCIDFLSLFSAFSSAVLIHATLVSF